MIFKNKPQIQSKFIDKW